MDRLSFLYPDQLEGQVIFSGRNVLRNVLRVFLTAGRSALSALDAPGFQGVEILYLTLRAGPFPAPEVEMDDQVVTCLETVEQVATILGKDEADVLWVLAGIVGNDKFALFKAVADRLGFLLYFERAGNLHGHKCAVENYWAKIRGFPFRMEPVDKIGDKSRVA